MKGIKAAFKAFFKAVGEILYLSELVPAVISITTIAYCSSFYTKKEGKIELGEHLYKYYCFIFIDLDTNFNGFAWN